MGGNTLRLHRGVDSGLHFDTERDLEDWFCRSGARQVQQQVVARQLKIPGSGILDVLTAGVDPEAVLHVGGGGPVALTVWELKNVEATPAALAQVARYRMGLTRYEEDIRVALLAPSYTEDALWIGSLTPGLGLFTYGLLRDEVSMGCACREDVSVDEREETYSEEADAACSWHHRILIAPEE